MPAGDQPGGGAYPQDQGGVKLLAAGSTYTPLKRGCAIGAAGITRYQLMSSMDSLREVDSIDLRQFLQLNDIPKYPDSVA